VRTDPFTALEDWVLGAPTRCLVFYLMIVTPLERQLQKHIARMEQVRAAQAAQAEEVPVDDEASEASTSASSSGSMTPRVSSDEDSGDDQSSSSLYV